jgi:hypothetical protein
MVSALRIDGSRSTVKAAIGIRTATGQGTQAHKHTPTLELYMP